MFYRVISTADAAVNTVTRKTTKALQDSRLRSPGLVTQQSQTCQLIRRTEKKICYPQQMGRGGEAVALFARDP